MRLRFTALLLLLRMFSIKKKQETLSRNSRNESRVPSAVEVFCKLVRFVLNASKIFSFSVAGYGLN